MARGVRPSAVLICLSILFVSSVLPGGAAVPTIHPPATTVDVGTLGVVDDKPYSVAKDGILVSPGTKVTIKADYLFRDSTSNTHTSINQAILRIYGENGQIGTDSVAMTFAPPNAYSWNGTLSFVLAVPENVRGLTAVLEARLTHQDGQTSSLIGVAQSSAPLTLVAVPQPVTFVSQDLVVGDSLDAGSIVAVGSQREATATDGKTFVSTEAGTTFTATATIERPAASSMSYIFHHATISVSVQVEGGGSYSSSRTVFSDFCSDWSTHACAVSAETRVGDVELTIPAGAIGPRDVVTVQVGSWHHFQAWNGLTGEGIGEMYGLGDSGRHVVIGA